MHNQEQELESSQETRPQNCAICHRPNQQILLLACSHDPCIKCAALHYFQGASLQSDFQLQQKQIYWCQICFEPTSIDGESISELNKYMKKKLKDRRGKNQNFTLTRAKSVKQFPSFRSNSSKKSLHHYNDFVPVSMKVHKPHHSKSKDKSAGEYFQFVRSQDFMQNSKYCPSQTPTQEKLQQTKNSKKLNSILKYAISCKKHPDQYQTYYCFDCLCSICVECALHGDHIGHEVQAVKKAGTRLRGIYEQVLTETLKYSNILDSQIKQINRAVEDFLAWNNKQQQIIKERFSLLFQILEQKQRNMLQELLQTQNQGMKKLKSQKLMYEKIFHELKGQRKQFKKNLSVEPTKWDITQLQGQKALMRNLMDTKLKNIGNYRKIDLELKYVQTDLLVEGIDMIQDLVGSFKITGQVCSPSQVKLI